MCIWQMKRGVFVILNEQAGIQVMVVKEWWEGKEAVTLRMSGPAEILSFKEWERGW